MINKKSTEDLSTEEKIKEAARTVFMKKGYSATRTRDIAEEAGINLALLNYYFRSKEKLFEIVMMEKMQKLFGGLVGIVTDNDTTLEKKIELLTIYYIDMLTQNPDLPIFVLSELRNNGEHLIKSLPIGNVLQQSALFKQLQVNRPDINPLHFIINILGSTIFPFVAKPMIQAVGNLNPKDFETMMEERKKLIPRWIRSMLQTK
ncbi:MAG: TetR/AcrR family transcriptional regulator [Bacteroidetes bacterium]|nr:TetR/AcrR family transcriptional regulator [Bacteroidota bacterium]